MGLVATGQQKPAAINQHFVRAEHRVFVHDGAIADCFICSSGPGLSGILCNGVI